MDDLSASLRRERDLLDQLRFRFVETRLLLAAGETRYLAWATAEVDQARIRVREADLLRASHIQRLADECRRGKLPTLRELATQAADPWPGILRDHHEGLCTLVSEIEVIGHRNAGLARAGIQELAEQSGPSLFDDWFASEADGSGSHTETVVPTLILDDPTVDASHADELADEHAYQDVISIASRLRMPALLEFLR